jgi:TolB-like protein
MKLIHYMVLTSSILSGCAANDQAATSHLNDNIKTLPIESASIYLNQYDDSNIYDRADNSNFQRVQVKKNIGSAKNINDYVRGIMQDLIGNMQYVSSATPLAVTSFVMLDGNYEKASLLGNQLAESFINEIHKFGIPIIDLKASDAVQVTATGDFILSRNISKLSSDLPILYVLAGTLVKYQGGHLINTRIIALESKAVVATAQGFLPEEISEALQNNNFKMNDGIISSNR